MAGGYRWGWPHVLVREEDIRAAEVGPRQWLRETEVAEARIRTAHAHRVFREWSLPPPSPPTRRPPYGRRFVRGYVIIVAPVARRPPHVELQDRLVEVQLNPRLEVMDVDALVCDPGLTAIPGTVGEQLITLYAAPALIVADDDHLTRQLTVAEPELVADQEPAGVVSNVELAPRPAWVGSAYFMTRHVGLHMSLPAQLGCGVFTERATDSGRDSKIGRRQVG